jgi:hypothetical protein
MTPNTTSLTLFEASGSFTIAPNSFYRFNSTADYTGADTVAVAVECPTGTSLKNILITTSWGNSLATFLTLTDAIVGSDFVLSNMGGGVVSVFGSELMVQIVNTGTTPVSCDQMTTYAVVH